MRRTVIIAGLTAAAALAVAFAAQSLWSVDPKSPGMDGAQWSTGGQAEAAANFAVAPEPRPQVSQPSGITVAGEGTVKTQPDVAYVTAGVQNTATSAQEAQQENARLMNAVLARLEGMGFTKKDLRTTALSVHPLYERPGGSPSGYQATNMVVVTVEDIGQAGAVFDAAVGAGANVAGNISFALKNDAPPRQQALREAVKAARTKANAIADEMGVTISGVGAVIEELAGGHPPVIERALAADAAAPPTPVLPGELTVSARVTVIYNY